MARLRYRIRPEAGPPFDDEDPTTVEVSPWWAPRSALSDGPRVTFPPDLTPPGWQPSREELERVADHVHGWEGIRYEGEPIACTRNMVHALCRRLPNFYAELVRAIDLTSTSGIL